MPSSSLWQPIQRYFLYYCDLDFSLDISRLKFPADFFEKMQPKIGKAFAAMRELEAGATANPTEKRMVGQFPCEVRELVQAQDSGANNFAPGEEPSEDRFSVRQER
jgi:glucose-6-phosphate isomerase